MKKNTLKWKILKYNLLAIFMLVFLVFTLFNITIRSYIRKDILAQLGMISERVSETLMRLDPEFFHTPRRSFPAHHQETTFHFYVRLMRSLRQPLSFVNADYFLLTNDLQLALTFEDTPSPSSELVSLIKESILASSQDFTQKSVHLKIAGIEHVAVINKILSSEKEDFVYMAIYSSLEKVNELKMYINRILIVILFLTAGLIALISSVLSKKISKPFSSLNEHIKELAGRNFSNKLDISVADEFQTLVANINLMSEKLDDHDKTQKIFLQNISHEFKTPLMSIQGYAEGILHNVVSKDSASQIIIEETIRLNKMVEDLLYLSKLDAIKEQYHLKPMDLPSFLEKCIQRTEGIALSKKNQNRMRPWQNTRALHLSG
jgi:two-component system, OmpR family, sensor histidine kinase CssS